MKSAQLFDIAGVSDENDEWYTPAWVFESLMVNFDLDPCSPGAPPSRVPAKRHLTKADNGLSATWQGCVWLNPPFSSKERWLKRMLEHDNGIALIPARTDSKWLQSCMESSQALLFLPGRLNFERASSATHGPTSHGRPPFGLLLAAYGDRMADALLDSKLVGVRAKVWKPTSSSVSESNE